MILLINKIYLILTNLHKHYTLGILYLLLLTINFTFAQNTNNSKKIQLINNVEKHDTIQVNTLNVQINQIINSQQVEAKQLIDSMLRISELLKYKKR